jgi:acetyl esterase/lipase
MTRPLVPVGLVLAGFLGLTALPLARSQQPDPKPKAPSLPEGTKEFRDLRYGPHTERNTLDLFVPKSDAPLPLIVWVHGGAWQGGSKSGGNPALPYLARGYAVASINYRLSQHAVFPAQIHDCKAAVRLLRANAKKYNLNPDAFGVWGASAGGHLVALLGTGGDVKELEGNVGEHTGVSSRVHAVCDYFGPTDLVRLSPGNAENAVSKLLGGPPREKKELATAANPITHASKDDPPFLIIHGDKDPLVPLSQSEILLDALKKAGVEAELIVIKDGGHGGPGFAARENQDKIAAFFDKHLKKK